MQGDTVRAVSPPDSIIAAVDSVYGQDFIGGHTNKETILLTSTPSGSSIASSQEHLWEARACFAWKGPHSATINSRSTLNIPWSRQYTCSAVREASTFDHLAS